MVFSQLIPSIFESIHQQGFLSLSASLWQSIIASGALGAGLYWLLSPSKTCPELDHVPNLSAFQLIWAVMTTTMDQQYENIWKKKFEKNGMVKISLFGKTVLYINDAEIVKYQNLHSDIIQRQERVDRYPKSYFSRLFGKNIFNANGDTWRRQRKVANPAFRDILDIQLFIEAAVELTQHITENQTQSFNAVRLMQRSTLDILGQAAFNFRFNALREPNGHLVSIYRDIVAELPNPLAVAFPKYDHYFRSKKAWSMLSEYENLIYGLIDEKRKNGVKKTDNDLLSRMMVANEDPENQTISDFELRSNIIIFMLAGHDTTAVSLGYLLYFLAMNKDAQARARKEVLDVLGPDLDINSETQRNLEYLNSCIKETLRLCPPAFQAFPRENTVDIQMNDGTTIPKGTTIIHHIYSMQHDERYWPDPEAFKPERFMDPDAPAYVTAWGPFSSGTRICIGMNFSLVEQKVIMSYLLRSFEIELAPGSIHEDGLKFNRRSFGLLTPREISINFRPIA